MMERSFHEKNFGKQIIKNQVKWILQFSLQTERLTCEMEPCTDSIWPANIFFSFTLTQIKREIKFSWFV